MLTQHGRGDWILAAIALPSYTQYLVRGGRAVAQSFTDGEGRPALPRVLAFRVR